MSPLFTSERQEEWSTEELTVEGLGRGDPRPSHPQEATTYPSPQFKLPKLETPNVGADGAQHALRNKVQIAAAPQREVVANASATAPAVSSPFSRRLLYRTIPLPPYDGPIVFVGEETSHWITNSQPEDLITPLHHPSVPELNATLAHALLSTSRSNNHPSPRSLRDEWGCHWSEPATVPGVGELTILHNSTGRTIQVRPSSREADAVTVGDIASILESNDITSAGHDGHWHSGGKVDTLAAEHERIRLVRNSLMLWWEPSEEGVHPWHLVIGR